MDRTRLISSLLVLALCECTVALPPLDSTQQAIVSTAVDDRDHQEAAFSVLVDELLDRSGQPARATSLQPPPEAWSAWVEAPDAQRGAPLILEGRVEQRTMLPRPWAALCELFVRLPHGTVVAVFAPATDDCPVGSRVRFEGRFYKRLSAVARDGVARRYPAVVARVVPTGGWGGQTVLLPLLLVGLGFCWVFFRRAAGSSRAPRKIAPPTVRSGKSSTIPSELPDEPARALDVLRSRHDHPDKGGAS